MGDFIGSAPPNQILFLMSIPCVGALLLFAFIGFSLNRRTKKSEMKLGIPPKSDAARSGNNMTTPAISPSPQTAASSQIQSEAELDLGVIGKNTATLEKSINTEVAPNLDLSARLHNPVSSTFDQVSSVANQNEMFDQNEMLRLLRDQQSGQLIIEVAGKQYATLADVKDKKIGQYILELTAHLLAFTSGMILSKNGIKTLPMPHIGDLPKPMPGHRDTYAQSAPMPTPTAAPKDVEEHLLSSLRANLSEAEVKPQKSGFFGLPKPVSPPTNLPTLNLADEINDIVQDRLRSSPLEQDNQITISSDPGGGIRIKVNNHYYSSPDDIANPAVRDLIKSSIKEWERR